MVKDWLRYYDFTRCFFQVPIIDGIESENFFLISLSINLIYIFLFTPSSFIFHIYGFLLGLYYSFGNTISKQLHYFVTEVIYFFFPIFAAWDHFYSCFFSIVLFFLLRYRIADIFGVIIRYFVRLDYLSCCLAWKMDLCMSKHSVSDYSSAYGSTN